MEGADTNLEPLEALLAADAVERKQDRCGVAVRLAASCVLVALGGIALLTARSHQRGEFLQLNTPTATGLEESPAAAAARLASVARLRVSRGELGEVVAAGSIPVPDWWSLCDGRGMFCDMRRNIKDELDYESRWAYEVLTALAADKIELYLGFFSKLRQHIADTNAYRASLGYDACPNMESWDEHVKYWNEQGLHVNLSGRAIANYVNSVHAQFKKASDGVHYVKATQKSCAWTQGEIGWGAARTAVERKIKGKAPEKFKFMWRQEKGRGVAKDLAAMVTGVDRSTVSNTMAEVFDNLFLLKKGEKEYFKNMPGWRKRRLPGFIRWANTFSNDLFGIFSYGDADAWVDSHKVEKFFYNNIVHGMAVHGRNLTAGSPADRMRYSGMPWIGGVSGSIVDFYLAALNMGYTGRDLAEMMRIDMACLVAGGQHSLGELIFSAVEADIEGGELSFEMNEETFTYFASLEWRRYVDLMNSPEEQWQTLIKPNALPSEGGLPGVYQAALDEFIRRAGPAEFERFPSKRVAMQERYKQFPELRPCLQFPGIRVFKLAVYMLDGPEQAIAQWEEEGMLAMSDGLSPEQFVMKLSEPVSDIRIVYTQAVFKEIAGGLDRSMTKEMFDAFVSGKTKGTPFLVGYMKTFHGKMTSRLWKWTPSKVVGETDFAQAFLESDNSLLFDLHGCVVSAVGAKDDRIPHVVYQSLYYMSWLD